MADADRRLRAVAARQHGVISRTQALDCGLSARAISRRLTAGDLVQVHPRTYALPGTAATWLQRLWAAHLSVQPIGAVSHRSAGALWELEGVPQGIVEITVRHVVSTRDVIVHRKRLAAGDVAVWHGLRITKPARTLLDLGDVLHETRIERALDDALHRGLVSLDELRFLLARAGGQGVRGTAIVRALVQARGPADVRSETTLERRLGRLIKRSDLPRPIAQFKVATDAGIIARPDFAYPEARLAIEAEGYRFHRDKQRWNADLARRSTLAAAGWRVLHFTWDDIHKRPDEVVAQIRRSLSRDGR